MDGRCCSLDRLLSLRGRLAAGGKGDPAGSAYYEGSWIESVVILVE